MMELVFESISNLQCSLPLALVGLFVVACSIWWYMPAGDKGRRLPPGRRGLPLLGESLDFYFSLSSTRPQKFAETRKARYGKLFRSNLFGVDTVISVDPEISKFVLQNEGDLFQSCYPSTMRVLIGEFSPLNLQGAMHKRVNSEAVRMMTPDRLRGTLMRDIEKRVVGTLDTWRNRIVYVEDEMKHFTLSLMAKQLFSFEPGCDTDYLVKNFFHLVKGLICLPLNFPGTRYNKALQARKNIVRLMTQLISDRRKQPQAKYNDFLAKLMDCEDSPLQTDEIVDFMLFLVLAGFETTASVITFAIKFLGESPKVLEKLREEHDAITKSRGSEESLTWEDYKSMTFTQCVVLESLRITAIPPTLFRRVLQDVEINGYIIPKGWAVGVHLLGMRLDQDLHPDPLAFNPWRWYQQEGINLKNASSLFPFGGGPRYCPGSELAKLEASIFLHYLVTTYNWELGEKDVISWFPLPFLSHRLPVKFCDRTE